MSLALVNTSRYPRGNGPRRVPDIRRTRPLPKPLPHQRTAPRGPIGNENWPTPNLRRAGITTVLRGALTLTRLARAANPISAIAGAVLDDLIQGQLDAALLPTAIEGFHVPSNWQLRTYCPKYPGGISGVGAWVYTSGIPPLTTPCIENQSTTNWPTFEEGMPRSTIGYGRKNGTGVLAARVNFSHSWSKVSGAPYAPYPELVPLPMPRPLPWPRNAPAPDPDLWPMELPYPVINPVLRPWPGSNARPAAGPTMRGGNRGNRAPGDKRKPRKNRDDWEEVKKPGKYVKEVKGVGDPMTLQMGLVKVGVGPGDWKAIPGRTAGAASEVLDLVTALFGALPEDIRRQYGTSPDDMLVALYRFAGEIDLSVATYNVAKTVLVDGVVGRGIGRAEASAVKAGGKYGLLTLSGLPSATLEQNSGGTVGILVKYGLDY